MASSTSEVDYARLRPPSIQGASAGTQLPPAGANPVAESTLDDLDRECIGYLLQDGKMTNQELATLTGMSRTAVSNRLRKLAANGTIIFSAIIDWEAAGFEWLVVVRLKTRARSSRQVAEDVSKLEQCENVAVTLGSHDVIAHFLVKNRTELRQLTDVDLPAIAGISDMSVDLATETSVTASGQKAFLARNPPPIRLPNPRLDLDELDIAILQELIDDGRQSTRQIARTREVSEGTIRARINRLTQAGLVRVVAMVEPVALGLAGVIASVSLHVDRGRIDKIKKEIATMPELLFMAVCVGSSDLSLLLTGADIQQLVELISMRVQAIEGVFSTDTLFMVDIVRVSPYMKRLDTAGQQSS